MPDGPRAFLYGEDKGGKRRRPVSDELYETLWGSMGRARMGLSYRGN